MTREIQPNWESMAANYHCPQWFQDGKIGVWMHWGISSAIDEDRPNDGSHYGRRYVTAALAHPAVIGLNKCQYQDELLAPDFLKQGLLKLDGTLYPTVSGIAAANRAAPAAVYGTPDDG